MGTLVCFHAHPDDEAISTGGTIAKAAAEGHRVVLVFATRGELGEVPDGLLRDGETLATRRVAEAHAAARILGSARVSFLGYLDSGMAGTPGNDDPKSFWRADLEQAATRLAAILHHERADVLTIYDANGGYGHPDHIKVHRVGMRAAEITQTRAVYEATLNRDYLRQLVASASSSGIDLPDLPDVSWIDGMGVPEALITTRVDVTAHIEAKREAMAAHASQITETSLFLSLPEPAFAATWGVEWFVRSGGTSNGMESMLSGL